MTTRLIVSDRIYIPDDKVDHEKVEKKFILTVYNEDKCNSCDYRPDRHCDMCDQCPSYVGTFKLFSERELNGKPYVGIPSGARNEIPSIVTDSDIRIKDLRSTAKMKHKITFTGTERDYQTKAREKMIKKGYGILMSAPRTGKTVIATSIICELGYKTLITAAQQDWLENFYETICGNPQKGIDAMTDAPDIEKYEGKKIVGFCKTYEDFEKHDICLATYQTFISSNGQKLLQRIKGMFGVVFLDECHDGAAPVLSRVINAFDAKHRFGLSATPTRKDGRMPIAFHVVGPVNHKTKVETLKPVVTFIETGFTPKKEYTLMHFALRALEKDEKRTKLIVDSVISDLKAGHSIVIPVAYTSQMTTLVDKINEKYGEVIAAGFHGKLSKDNRKKLVADARSGKIRVVVGIRKIVQVGLNVPRWSCLYEIVPIANIPKHTQEVSRILTPLEGKPTPLIRQFLDNVGFARGCLRVAVYRVYIPLGFKISPRDMAIAKPYLSRSKITPCTGNGGSRGITVF